MMAGMKVLLAVEMDEHAVHTYRTNFPHTPVFAGDIHELTSAEVLETTGLKPGELDILDGSPPCQGFSVAGLRKFSDDRNSLFKEYVRLARDLQPRVLVMENVPGLVTGKMKLIFAEMLTELKSAGYDVEARVLNAMYYGVPQSRNRVIFIGVRKDLGIRPSHPVGLDRVVSFSEATRGLPIAQATRLRGLALELWSRTEPGRAFSDHHPKGHWFNAVKVHPGRPTGTVTKTCFMGQAGLYHHRYARPLTIAELKRVASFPDWFRFDGKFTDQWARIGNSVPPAFMEKIALHIEAAILSPADRCGQEPRHSAPMVDPERATETDPSLGSARAVRTQRGSNGGAPGEDRTVRPVARIRPKAKEKPEGRKS
jgi:DNA (cytosine-5)-methyltransferase 1